MESITLVSLIAALTSIVGAILSYRKIQIQKRQEEELLLHLERKSNKYLKELSKYLEEGGKISTIEELEGSLTKEELAIRNSLFEKYILSVINNQNNKFSEVREALYKNQKINSNYLEKIHKSFSNVIQNKGLEYNRRYEVEKLIFELEEQKEINKLLRAELSNKVNQKNKIIDVQDKDILRKIDSSQIVFIKAEDFGCRIHFENKSFWTNTTLLQMMDKLPTDNFIRIFRGTVINVNHVEWINYNTLKVSSGEELKIGRKYKNDILRKFK